MTRGIALTQNPAPLGTTRVMRKIFDAYVICLSLLIKNIDSEYNSPVHTMMNDKYTNFNSDFWQFAT